jgi:hypothetical protein
MNVFRWLKTWGVTALLVWCTTFLLTRDIANAMIVAAVCLGSGLYMSL